MDFFVVGGDSLISQMFKRRGWKEVYEPKHDTLIVFTGGADVSPELYGHARHPTTGCDAERDLGELWTFHQYRKNPKVGICRGGQFLNVASGGEMWQNVDGHAINGTHNLIDMETGTEIPVTSTHHQMMRPSNMATWLAYAKKATTLESDDEVLSAKTPDIGTNIFGDDEEVFDCEVIFYDETQSLCFQPHPEYGVKPCENYFFKCLRRMFEI